MLFLEDVLILFLLERNYCLVIFPPKVIAPEPIFMLEEFAPLELLVMRILLMRTVSSICPIKGLPSSSLVRSSRNETAKSWSFISMPPKSALTFDWGLSFCCLTDWVFICTTMFFLLVEVFPDLMRWSVYG